mmetsp:Transcript_10762/g.15845  ORF Transcript_10762/g.15845 Transcript_10762/m.15845 type:complete len:841 (+) Transcript_10762:245-2767(+)|eukprot:CAMPEP_0194216996 /NCGR_PEP_ID=MMETSP0156-20130528/20135_1 /TAXON_ID=33649 /ORGANISM="Thalassionema nitzschioides, Strain L26-B" /LENGTH=840 /DNA_ID=CAMNT_0038945905 /DNA_START=222 /DNA_END=2744 /DNA_ORIENTATION=+
MSSNSWSMGGSPSVEESCVLELETTYKDNLGSFANMFDIVTYHSIDLYALEIYTDIVEDIFYAIYTKPNSFKEDGAMNDLSVWTLVKEGSAKGRGFGNGTPIRDFDIGNLTIDANETRAFYVTLNSTDLRYRNITGEMPDAKVGDMFAKNEDLGLQIGISVGEYPLTSNTTYFFGERVWSGTMYYNVNRPCPSRAPSMVSSDAPSGSVAPSILSAIPSLIPSITPTTIISSSPSLVPSFAPSLTPSFPDITIRPDLTTENGDACHQSDSLVTAFDAGTGAYGSMFSVTSKEETIQVTTLSFHTDYGGGNVTAIVYTKIGDFVGHENEPSAWTKISQSTLRGSGKGHGSTIRKDDFQSVILYPNETVSFYISLTTADIRYTKLDGVELGDSVASNSYLDINAGIGLADYPFASEYFIYSPRLFNGIVHFDRRSACLSETNVTYSFNINHIVDVRESELFELVANLCDQVARMLMVSDDKLTNLRVEHDMSLDMASAKKGSNITCAIETSGYVCTPVEITLKFKHGDGIRDGKLRHIWRVFYPEISSGVNTLFDAHYGGETPVQTNLNLTLTTSSVAAEMPNATANAFEMAVLNFLKEKMKGTAIKVLDAEVTAQAVRNVRYLARDDDSVNGRPMATLDISTIIVGEYRPPPQIDFSGVVEDAIDADEQSFDEEIRRADEFFEVYDSIDVVENVTKPLEIPDTQENSQSISTTLIIILVAVLVGFFIFVGGYCYHRKKAKKRKGFDDTFVKGSDALKEERSFFPRISTKRRSLNNGSIMDDNMSAVQWTMSTADMSQADYGESQRDYSVNYEMDSRREDFYDEAQESYRFNESAIDDEAYQQ